MKKSTSSKKKHISHNNDQGNNRHQKSNQQFNKGFLETVPAEEPFFTTDRIYGQITQKLGRKQGENTPNQGNNKPTIITIRYDYEIRESNIPFVETYRSALSGDFTQLTDPNITDISFGDPGGGYQINVEIPRVYAHNRENPTYTTQIYIGSDLDNLEKKDNSSLVGAFFDGFKTGIATALLDEAVSSGVFSKYKLPSRFKLSPAKKGGGMRFIDPKNAQNEIRVMKGNPNSPHVSQQTAYLKYRHKGTYYDAKGNPIKSSAGGGRSAEAHISIKDYNPSMMPKFE